VILAGHGIIISGAMNEVRELPSVPAFRWRSRCSDWERFRLLIRSSGHDGHAWRGLGQPTIQEADLLLAFGMRFDDRVTGT